ncbi:L,D-transpeptidase Cds6 family protein [Helicobacter turcicus]|uniref:L,D-transpeptidase family protein n=1 Tax=Helicobacter turcicus TaxID=2867412 RepID=A0ABS7JN01_9HELI|nr:L,D-transpeptidase family protein [Helicobacter turcicus]MBX7490781.1 L,D-transpeptidase family protein [Helicobacter turcicus]MBX7545610.1 L,D-transpeptidase family protein [Helicobacter turcicus]
MKIFKIFSLCLMVGLAYASDLEWVELYKKGGTKAIEQKIDSIMQTRSFWNEALKEQDTRFGYYEDLKYLFIATKNAPTLRLYALENHQWNEKLNVESLVGSKGGNKEKEGDLATPIGVYSLNARLVNLDQYYGPLAFATNYPNLYDRLQKRTGYGIWIHGRPLDGNRKELNTRGCIVIENDKLSSVDAIIDYRQALLVTFENNAKEVKKEDLSILLTDLYAWKNAWKESNVDKYLGFYSEDFTRFDGMKYDEFVQNKRRIFAKNERKEIVFSKINISPYPNDENRHLFRISFYEDYKAPSYRFSGEKELYIELKNSKMQILAER